MLSSRCITLFTIISLHSSVCYNNKLQGEDLVFLFSLNSLFCAYYFLAYKRGWGGNWEGRGGAKKKKKGKKKKMKI